MDLFLMLAKLLFLLFGSVAFAVLVYCICTRNAFKEVYPVAVEKFVKWICRELFGEGQATGTTEKLPKERIEPIRKTLCENGCECIDRYSYVQYEVAHYQFQLPENGKVKELDFSYLEKLIQLVYYEKILILYQNSGLEKESIDVFIKKEDLFLFIYVGHSTSAYAKINEYRAEVTKRTLENMNKKLKEMEE